MKSLVERRRMAGAMDDRRWPSPGSDLWVPLTLAQYCNLRMAAVLKGFSGHSVSHLFHLRTFNREMLGMEPGTFAMPNAKRVLHNSL